MQRENHQDLDQELTRTMVDIQLLDILDIVSEGLIFQCEKKQWKIDSKFIIIKCLSQSLWRHDHNR